MTQQIKRWVTSSGSKLAWTMMLAAGAWGFPSTAAAVEEFSNGGIRFDVDTVIEFEFLESNGSYQSVFGIVNLETGDLQILESADREREPTAEIFATIPTDDFTTRVEQQTLYTNILFLSLAFIIAGVGYLKANISNSVYRDSVTTTETRP